MKDNWDARKPIKQNLKEMGLAFNANEVGLFISYLFQLSKYSRISI